MLPESFALYPDFSTASYLPHMYPASSMNSIRIFSGVQTDNLNPKRVIEAANRAMLGIQLIDRSELYFAMLASEEILSKEWLSPEEDEAWADL